MAEVATAQVARPLVLTILSKRGNGNGNGMATLLRLNSFYAAAPSVYKRFMEGGDNVPFVASHKLNIS